MAQIDRLRKRGATYTVATKGEVLFAPGTELSRWKNRFSQRIRAATAAAAPANKRPRWAHYGKPLKSTFTASTLTRVTSGGGYYYVAVGSSARHAGYVNEGTGTFAGRSPWVASILPPTSQGGANLYERTWIPGGPPGTPVRGVLIKGQRGQRFMEKGLERASKSMRLRSYQVSGEGVSAVRASNTFPPGLSASVGPRPEGYQAAFRSSLEQWRRDRDAAFNFGRDVRTGSARTRPSRAKGRPNRRTPEQDARRREESAKRSQRRRDEQSERKKKALAKNRNTASAAFNARKAQARRDFIAAIEARGGGDSYIADSVKFVGGRWTAKVFPPRTGRGATRPITVAGPIVR